MTMTDGMTGAGGAMEMHGATGVDGAVATNGVTVEIEVTTVADMITGVMQAAPFKCKAAFIDSTDFNMAMDSSVGSARLLIAGR
jgi:hypothetical protein